MHHLKYQVDSFEDQSTAIQVGTKQDTKYVLIDFAIYLNPNLEFRFLMIANMVIQ
jgi:hypothetical protein